MSSTDTESSTQQSSPLIDGRIIAWCYVSIQLSIALFISIIGAVHVKRCIDEIKNAQHTNNEQTDYQKTIQEEEKQETEEKKQETVIIDVGDEEKRTNVLTINNATEPKKRQNVCKLWGETVWKMRGVYGGLAVHSFDVLTDILVVYQWLLLKNTKGDNINPRVMAYAGIAVLLTSKIVSTIGIYLKEGNIRRAILQFFDILIFEEIYESHKKIVSQIKNKKSIKDKSSAIESTLSFKYVRNFEAVFESIPQSVLQLVFIMRVPAENTDGYNKYNPIFIVSIIQSIISMTNSILNNDYTQMQDVKFKKYKQRLPPTFEFFKHSLCRFSEVVYRIGLLALFWTVCEGLAFSIMLSVELSLILMIAIFFIYDGKRELNADTFLLAINTLIVVPSEEVYTGRLYDENIDTVYDGTKRFMLGYCLFATISSICCCFGLTSCLTSFVRLFNNRTCIVDFQPTMRVSASISELIIIIFYGIYAQNGQREMFLLSFDHGLSILIVTCTFLIIYTQFGVLFPDFSLPLNANVRSKWGYAYSNEFTELKKIKVRTSKKAKKIKHLRKTYKGDFETDTYDPTLYNISNASEFWDEPFRYSSRKIADKQPITAAIFALVKENYDIIQWLEEQGAVAHKNKTPKAAAWMIGVYKDTKWGVLYPNSYDKGLEKLKAIKVEIEEKPKYIDGVKYEIKNEVDFWDEPFTFIDEQPVTAAMFAIAAANNDDAILEWLEQHGAVKHKALGNDQAVLHSKCKELVEKAISSQNFAAT